jgi:succinate dehydrogenase / fumarate reductase cytochrome b subunit
MEINKENRSLSPHLYAYKPQITSVISIFHRITGSLLAIILLCTPICINLLTITF